MCMMKIDHPEAVLHNANDRPCHDTCNHPIVDSGEKKCPSQTLTEKQKAFAEQVPKAHRGKYLRAMTTPSLRAAIDAMCAACFGFEMVADGIRNCTDETCPLFSHRRVGTWRAGRNET